MNKKDIEALNEAYVEIHNEGVEDKAAKILIMGINKMIEEGDAVGAIESLKGLKNMSIGRTKILDIPEYTQVFAELEKKAEAALPAQMKKRNDAIGAAIPRGDHFPPGTRGTAANRYYDSERGYGAFGQAYHGD